MSRSTIPFMVIIRIQRIFYLKMYFFGPLAQVVEQQPFKLWVVGSSPTRLTKKIVRPHRLARSRTPPFHGENMGSNPIGDAKFLQRFY